MMSRIAFQPSQDTATLLHALLDRCERRESARRRAAAAPAGEPGQRAVRCKLSEIDLPGYNSQVDPDPRLIANTQLQQLEQAGLVRLDWEPGESGHLLSSVTLEPNRQGALFQLIGRTPLASQRERLAGLLSSEQYRFSSPEDWRLRAIRQILAQLQVGKSPAPFSLVDEAGNEDLLLALEALGSLQEETPFRVFSVRVFNDSKRLEELKPALTRLARRGRPDWCHLTVDEVLREINLVANPSYLVLSGEWELVSESGQVLSCSGFYPAVGISAVQAGGLVKAFAYTPAVMCIENATTFYEFVRSRTEYEKRAENHRHGEPTQRPPAVLCLGGNPAPAVRHLLSRLCENLDPEVDLHVWADLDYGGFNILSQLRRLVSPRFHPVRMDVETFEQHHRWARPLTPADVHNLKALRRRPELADVCPVIDHLLQRSLKLEQEAITP